jgi:putative transposase
MGLRFPQQRQGDCFFVTTTFSDWNRFGEVEGVYTGICRSLEFCKEKYEALLSGYVLMPSHIHLLIFIDGSKLPDFMRDFKKYVSQKVAKDLRLGVSTVWRPRYDTVAIYSDDVFRTKLEYIHNNPVKSGLVGKPEDWEWSSARAYNTEEKAEIEVWKGWA